MKDYVKYYWIGLRDFLNKKRGTVKGIIFGIAVGVTIRNPFYILMGIVPLTIMLFATLSDD